MPRNRQRLADAARGGSRGRSRSGTPSEVLMTIRPRPTPGGSSPTWPRSGWLIRDPIRGSTNGSPLEATNRSCRARPRECLGQGIPDLRPLLPRGLHRVQSYWGLTEQFFRNVMVLSTRWTRNRETHRSRARAVRGQGNRPRSGCSGRSVGLGRGSAGSSSRTRPAPSWTPWTILRLGGGIRQVADTVQNGSSLFAELRNDERLLEYIERFGNRSLYKRLGYLDRETWRSMRPRCWKTCARRMSQGVGPPLSWRSRVDSERPVKALAADRELHHRPPRLRDFQGFSLRLGATGRWGVGDVVVENDYVLGWLLWGIGSEQNAPGASGCSRAGPASRSATSRDHRFSQDLDFTVLEGWSRRSAAAVLPDTAIRCCNRVSRCLRDSTSPSPNPGWTSPPGEANFARGRIYYTGPRRRPHAEARLIRGSQRRGTPRRDRTGMENCAP